MKNHDEANVLHWWKTKLCRNLHRFGMFTQLTLWDAVQVLSDFIWNLRQPNLLRRSFPSLVLLDRKGPLSAASLVIIVSVKHFSCHNCFRETYLLSMYFKYVVSEKLAYYDFEYYLCSRQDAKDCRGSRWKLMGHTLIKMYNWPMSVTHTIGE